MNFSVALMLLDFHSVKFIVEKDNSSIVLAERHFKHLYSTNLEEVEPWCSLEDEGVVIQQTSPDTLLVHD